MYSLNVWYLINKKGLAPSGIHCIRCLLSSFREKEREICFLQDQKSGVSGTQRRAQEIEPSFFTVTISNLLIANQSIWYTDDRASEYQLGLPEFLKGSIHSLYLLSQWYKIYPPAWPISFLEKRQNAFFVKLMIKLTEQLW